jgi:hypothetical protein
MILHQEMLDKNKKANRFYMKMSEFLNNGKKNEQCRCHHSKKMKEINDLYGKKMSER